jgi:predicted nucleic acid-binding protein
MTDGTPSPAVYVDANPFIYFIEGEEAAANRLRPFFDLLKQKPGAAMTSELTLAEVLAKARPDSRRGLFNLIVWSGLFRLEPVTRDILIETADYRRVTRRTLPDGKTATVKLPDAIHVVTAIRARCRIFLSADVGIRLPVDMTALQPTDDGVSALVRALT